MSTPLEKYPMSRHCRHPRGSRLVLASPVWILWIVWLLIPATLSAAPPALQVYAHTFDHRSPSDASRLVRPLLSPRGTVEVQPGSHTLVVRDVEVVIAGVRETIEAFDVPPAPMRLDVQVIRAGPTKRGAISPPSPTPQADSRLTSRLRKLLRYEDYEVVAHAELSAREGEAVDYALGERFAVSFQLGDLIAGRRMQMQDFQVMERPSASTDKGRRPDPRSLFDAHLNLWVDRPFTLVLTRDEERQEALLIVVTVERELAESTASPDE